MTLSRSRFGEVWSTLASLWEGAAKGMMTSFIIRCLDWQAHNRLLGQLSAMASIGLGGVLPNGIPRP
jgi:hypothetical protein